MKRLYYFFLWGVGGSIKQCCVRLSKVKWFTENEKQNYLEVGNMIYIYIYHTRLKFDALYVKYEGKGGGKKLASQEFSWQ